MSFLTDAEVVHLTGYEHKPEQAEALRKMGIPFRLRPRDGKPVVTWEAVNGREKRRADPFRWDMVT